MNPPLPTEYSVIIVGGGPAGCAAALALSRSSPGLSFLVLDDSDPLTFKIGESLPPEALRLLRYLSPDLPTRLAQDTANGTHLTCTGNVSAWESDKLHETYSIMNPFGAGWHLDRAAFEETLRETVRSRCTEDAKEGGVEAYSGSRFEKAKFVGIEKQGECWLVIAEDIELKTKKQYSAKWVIDSTGRKASLAHKLGAKTIKDDNLLAFYALFSSPQIDYDRRTFIEAAPSGWWYTSQLSNNLRVVVYHTDDSDPTSKLARRREGFLDLLQSHCTHISKLIDENDYRPMIDTRSPFPRCTAACSSHLEPYGSAKEGWIAVGDAAMAFDPLSSQGMITALEMGCSVGIILGKKLSEAGKRVDSELFEGEDRDIKELYAYARKDYRKNKKYYYTQARFDGEFWQNRRQNA